MIISTFLVNNNSRLIIICKCLFSNKGSIYNYCYLRLETIEDVKLIYLQNNNGIFFKDNLYITIIRRHFQILFL